MCKRLILTLMCLSFFIAPSGVNGGESDKFRFAVMGCMHLGFCTTREFESALEKMKEYQPDFVLFCGGMIDPGTEKSPLSLWQAFDGAVGKLGVPVYDTPGNCCLTDLLVSEEKSALMEKNFLARYKHRYYSFEYKNNLFIGLDSKLLNLGKGHSFDNQLNFLKNLLADASKYHNVFIFTHNSQWLDADSTWGKVIQPLIDGKVKFMFGARKHFLNARKIGDVTCITTGTPPCYLRAYSSQLTFFNFLIAEVEKDKVSIKIVPVDPIPIENLGTLTDSTIEGGESLHSVRKPYLLTADARKVFLIPDRVIKTLKIKPGMDILDLGSGAGFFTFRLAEALKGSGRVFATDTDPAMVKYMQDKIEEIGYRNIFPVNVESQGVDPFYKQHSFDLIFMCEAYQYLRHPEEYFRELRPSLKKEGRLYIIHDKNIYGFTEVEMGDFSNLIKVMASKEKDFPVIQKMDQDVQDFIKSWQGETVPPEMRQRIIANLNKMLLDRWLFYDLIDYFTNKGMVAWEGEWSSPLKFILADNINRDIRLVKWLFVGLDTDGVFAKKEKPLTAINKRQLRKLNKILLCNILQTDRIEGLQGEYGIPVYLEKDSVISSMKAAGYQFVREYDFLPLDYFLEFKRKF